ncbi:MAG: EamA family transporter, partial [Gaiellales bacterium]
MNPTADPAPVRPLWPWQLAALALIWGSSFMLIKVGLEAFGPLQVAAGRISIGAITLLIALAVTGTRLPRPGRIWGHALVVGVLMNVIPFSLF